MPTLKFYDLKTKTSFETDEFELKEKQTSKGVKFFAIADAPSGVKSWRIVSKDFFEANKK